VTQFSFAYISSDCVRGVKEASFVICFHGFFGCHESRKGQRYRRLVIWMLSSVQSTRMQSSVPALRFAVSMLFFALIYLQKVGVGSGGISVSLALPALYLVLVILAVRGRLLISLSRLTLFAIFAFFATLSQALVNHTFSILSFIFVMSLYLPMTVVWTLRRDEWRDFMSVFQNMMIVPACMVFVQIGWQVIFHQQALSIEPLFPKSLLMQGFMYTAPIHWGHPLIRPNGFFMLEPSYISAFTACALVLELSTFHRIWRMALYGGALWACTGATGLVLAGVAVPIMLARRHPGLFLVGCAAVLLGAVIVAETGAATSMIGRLSELQNKDSSGFGRLVAPLIQLHQVTDSPSSLFAGLGAGNSSTELTIESSTWPLVKLGVEYGMPTLLIFAVFILACFSGAPVPALAAALYVVYNFTGGYLLNPVFVILMMLLATGIRIRHDESFVETLNHRSVSRIGSGRAATA
jgi:hypothetical protein